VVAKDIVNSLRIIVDREPLQKTMGQFESSCSVIIVKDLLKRTHLGLLEPFGSWC